MSDLTICTPFAGYETPYLQAWLQTYAEMAQGTGARAIWLDNSGDRVFGELLAAAAADMPIPVEVIRNPIRLGNAGTPEGKNNTVCIVWTLLDQAVRTERLLRVESDVFVPPGAPEILFAALDRHPPLAAVSAAVSEAGWMENRGTMAWRIRQPEPRRGHNPPRTRESISWYEPEGADGIEMVDAVPWGCLALYTETARALPPRATQFPRLGHDQEWCELAWQQGRPVAVHWGVRCRHHRDLVRRQGWWQAR